MREPTIDTSPWTYKFLFNLVSFDTNNLLFSDKSPDNTALPKTLKLPLIVASLPNTNLPLNDASLFNINLSVTVVNGSVTLPLKVGDVKSALYANWFAIVASNELFELANASDNWFRELIVVVDATLKKSVNLFSTYNVVAIWSVGGAATDDVGAVGIPVNAGEYDVT